MTDERAADDGQADERSASTGTIDPGEHLFDEKNRIEGLNRIRQLVFGSLDGLLVPLGVANYDANDDPGDLYTLQRAQVAGIMGVLRADHPADGRPVG